MATEQDVRSTLTLRAKQHLGSLVAAVEGALAGERLATAIQAVARLRHAVPGESVAGEPPWHADLRTLLACFPAAGGVPAPAVDERCRTALAHLEQALDELLRHCGQAAGTSAGAEMVYAQEAERKRISREIHDGPAQALANLTMRIDFCLDQVGKPELLATELRDLRAAVVQSLRDIRRFIFDLRPMALDDLGLVPTIEQYIAGFRTRTGIEVHLSVDGERFSLANDRELAVFRVIQESLTNAHRHAQSTCVQIFMACNADQGRLDVVVKDNGVGFDYAKTRAAYAGLGKLGLVSMEERVKLAGGSLSIVSTPGEGGTVVSFWVPK